MFDVFLSYASTDGALADPLVQALEQAGLRVWRDTRQIDAFSDIQRAITAGLARSKVLLALYSHAYTQRRACDWELAAAFVTGGPGRILVLNPEDGAEHIQPQSLREHRFANRADLADPQTLVARIRDRVAGFDTSFGQLPRPAPDQKWVGLSRQGGAQTFVGRRAEIWRVHYGLAAGSVLLAPTTAGTAAGDGSTLLRGLGGMGKTLLAEEYARRFSAAWPGGIFWLKAGGELMDQYLMLAGELGASFDPADPHSLKRAVTDAMAARPGDYLWVVDDLPHGLTAQQARAWFAPTAQGRTLVTTRTRTLDAIARPVELAELGEDEALLLLTLNRTPKDAAEEKAAQAIVAELGRHALAVDLARHLVRLQGYPKVLADLRDPDKEALALAERLSIELPTGHEKSIAQTFLRSIQMLDANGLDALRVAAQLAPHTAIPQALLARIRMEADDLPKDQAEEEALLAVAQGEAHSLCEISEDGYVVHALVCRTVFLRYGDGRNQTLQQAGVEVLLRVFQRAGDARFHPGLTPLLPHARAIAEPTETAQQARLILWLGRFYDAAGLYPAALEFNTRAVTARRNLLGPDHPDTLTSMNNLADTLYAQGDLDSAREMEEQVLAARRRILAPDHPDILASMNNLAGTRSAQGDLTGARELQEQVLAAFRRILGPDHPSTLASMNNLANTLHALGDLDGARDLQEATLTARQRVLGPDHPDTLTGMINLASTLYDQGDLDSASELEEQALAANRRILGPYHPVTLTGMNNLSLTRFAQGHLDGARDLQEPALTARQRILGPAHPDTLTSMGNLASILHAQGYLASARDLQEQVLAARRRILGPDHPDTLTSINNLASTLHAQGDLVGARDMEEQALATRRRILGPDHPDTLTSMNNLANTLHAQGDMVGARDLQEQVLAASRRILGPDHPNTLTRTYMLAQYTALSGDLAQAIDLARGSAQGLAVKLGPDHPDTKTAEKLLFLLTAARNAAPGPD
ncbi:MAG: tetratricopeptide repeat protein [Alphaproteobacteria bacterium]|nr:tetratricopeptide repeat protein [Alphaproteobacteria bacterium]